MLMQACKKYNPSVKTVKTGTRGQHGPSARLPANERAPMNPRGIYEVSNLADENIMQA